MFSQWDTFKLEVGNTGNTDSDFQLPMDYSTSPESWGIPAQDSCLGEDRPHVSHLDDEESIIIYYYLLSQ